LKKEELPMKTLEEILSEGMIIGNGIVNNNKIIVKAFSGLENENNYNYEDLAKEVELLNKEMCLEVYS
jgi:hypothetical protein